MEDVTGDRTGIQLGFGDDTGASETTMRQWKRQEATEQHRRDLAHHAGLARIALGAVAQQRIRARKVLPAVGAQEALLVAVCRRDVTVAVVLADEAGVTLGVGLALE